METLLSMYNKTIPGFIDLQVNGFFGVDFSSEDLTEEKFIRVSKALLERGCAGFLATVITSSEALYQRNLPLIAKAMRSPELQGGVLGIHAEGPFLNKRPGAVGAHNPDWIRSPETAFFKQMLDWAEGTIKILTLAAEVPGAAELTAFAVEQGVTVSLGHQLAQGDDMRACAAAGATLLTHFGNGLPNDINRHHNPIWAGLAEDKLTAMIITDGHHLPPALIKAIIRTKGTKQIIVTSDASPIAGLPPGHYQVLDNKAILEVNGLLHNPEKQCLVGSSSTILDCVNYLASLDLLSPEELVKVAFDNPLEAIGLDAQSVSGSNQYAWEQQAKRFVRK